MGRRMRRRGGGEGRGQRSCRYSGGDRFGSSGGDITQKKLNRGQSSSSSSTASASSSKLAAGQQQRTGNRREGGGASRGHLRQLMTTVATGAAQRLTLRQILLGSGADAEDDFGAAALS